MINLNQELQMHWMLLLGKRILLSYRGIAEALILWQKNSHLKQDTVWRFTYLIGGRYGKAAGVLRNEEMVKDYDAVIAFWDGKSKGTLSTIRYAERVGKECEIIICK